MIEPWQLQANGKFVQQYRSNTFCAASSVNTWKVWYCMGRSLWVFAKPGYRWTKIIERKSAQDYGCLKNGWPAPGEQLLAVPEIVKWRPGALKPSPTGVHLSVSGNRSLFGYPPCDSPNLMMMFQALPEFYDVIDSGVSAGICTGHDSGISQAASSTMARCASVTWRLARTASWKSNKRKWRLNRPTLSLSLDNFDNEVRLWHHPSYNRGRFRGNHSVGAGAIASTMPNWCSRWRKAPERKCLHY